MLTSNVNPYTEVSTKPFFRILIYLEAIFERPGAHLEMRSVDNKSTKSQRYQFTNKNQVNCYFVTMHLGAFEEDLEKTKFEK